MTLEYEAMLRGERPIHPDYTDTIKEFTQSLEYKDAAVYLTNYLCRKPSPEEVYQYLLEGKVSSGCILPINLSKLSIAKNSNVLHAPHIQVAGKNYEKVGDWYLTGTLESKARCGEFVRAVSCEDYGQDDLKHTRYIETYSCHRPGCPVCYESWATREANSATERLFGGQELYHEVGKNFSLKHVVFSPGLDDQLTMKVYIESGNYKRVKAEALRMMKQAGAIGGCVTPHFWRQVGEKEAIPDNVVIPEGLKEGDWYFSIHWHSVLAGFLIPSAKFYNETGWVYINLGKRKSIKNTIFYFLTHCANHQNHHALTWFGIFSYRALCIDHIDVIMESIPCSACEKPVHHYGLDLSFDCPDTLEPDWSIDKGILFRKVKIRYFKLHSSNSGG